MHRSKVGSLMPKNNSFKFFMVIILLGCCDAFFGGYLPGVKPQNELVNPGAEIILGALINVTKEGDIILGCGERRADGFTSTEALKWATDKLNKKIWSSSSSNISIGLKIMDSCSSTTVASIQLVNFLPELGFVLPDGEDKPYKFGVIDDVGLANSFDVWNALEKLKIPALRTDISINSEQEIITAVLNIMQEMRWDHIALVYSNAEYSLSLLKSFAKTFKKFDLCVPWLINIENAVDDGEYKELESVMKHRIPIVSLLASEQNDLVLKSVKNITDKGRRYHTKTPMLFTDLIIRDHLKMAPVSYVQLFALVPLPEKDKNFEEYFWRNSKLTDMKKEDDLEMLQRTKTLRKMQIIMDKFSVSLRSLMKEFCQNDARVCDKVLSPEGRSFAFEQLKEIDSSLDLDLYGLMEYQFRNPEGHILLHKVLTYNRFKNVDVFEKNLPFVEVFCDNNPKPYKRECNCLEVKPIRKGSARNIVDRNKKRVNVEHSNSDSTTSSPPEKQYLEPYYYPPTPYSMFHDPIKFLIASFTIIGGVITLFIVVYFNTFVAIPNGGIGYGTGVIGYIILVSIFCLYVTNFSFIMGPTILSCTTRRFGTSVSYAFIFSGMMIKVWAAMKEAKSDKEDLPKGSTLVALAVLFSIPQILSSGLWMILIPPSTFYDREKGICYTAGDMDSHLLVSMAYDIVILLVTAILAIHASGKSKKRETRWILISTSIVAVLFSIWGTLIATGVFLFQRTAIMNLISATILLSFIYAPKVKAHTKLQSYHMSLPTYPRGGVIKIPEDYPMYTPYPPQPLMLDSNRPPPPPSEEISDPGFPNQAYSIDTGTESLSLPLDIDTASTSDVGQEPLAFKTFLDDITSADAVENISDLDPTQVVPSNLYPIDMFNNEPNVNEKNHYEPGSNEFTPQQQMLSQLYVYPMPEWGP